MITDTITIKLDPQQIQDITREVQRQAFRCGDCAHFTGHGRAYGACQQLALAGLTLVDRSDVPMPMPTVHQDFGCNRFEEVKST